MTFKSVFNSKLEETVLQHQQAMGSDGIYGGKAKSKRCDFKYFLKVATERTDGQQVVPKRRGTRVKSSCTSIGLNPRD